MKDQALIDQTNSIRRHVIQPVLDYLTTYNTRMKSNAAENLLVGTALKESTGFRHWRQQPDGPAVSIFGIEPATHWDLWKNYFPGNDALAGVVRRLRATEPRVEIQLTSNHLYACAIARCVYWRKPDPLPTADDIEALAEYWGKYYNTHEDESFNADWVKWYRKANPPSSMPPSV